MCSFSSPTVWAPRKFVSKNIKQNRHLLYLPLSTKGSGLVSRSENKKIKYIFLLKKNPIPNIMHYPKEYKLPAQNSNAFSIIVTVYQ